MDECMLVRGYMSPLVLMCIHVCVQIIDVFIHVNCFSAEDCPGIGALNAYYYYCYC